MTFDIAKVTALFRGFCYLSKYEVTGEIAVNTSGPGLLEASLAAESEEVFGRGSEGSSFHDPKPQQAYHQTLPSQTRRRR